MLRDHPPPSVADRLLTEPFVFDFFQAVRLIQALEAGRAPVGRSGPPEAEVVRFRAHLSLSFPPSSIAGLQPPASPDRPFELTQPFLGLTGPSGVLPRHYTELLFRVQANHQFDERYALRDWLDLFNHRLVSLFYRAWEKYRPHLGYDPDRFADPEVEPDALTRGVFSLIGIGTGRLRGRLFGRGPGLGTNPVASRALGAPSRAEDLALIRYAGLLAHRPRSAEGLRALLLDYFGLGVEISQFQGRWMALEPASQSRIASDRKHSNNCLGMNAVVGERIWDVQGSFRIRLGPLTYAQFRSFLPDRNREVRVFLLAQLVRFYVGLDLDFDLQLVLRREDVPRCQLPVASGEGPVLGWDCWLIDDAPAADSDDVIFDDADIES